MRAPSWNSVLLEWVCWGMSWFLQSSLHHHYGHRLQATPTPLQGGRNNVLAILQRAAPYHCCSLLSAPRSGSSPRLSVGRALSLSQLSKPVYCCHCQVPAQAPYPSTLLGHPSSCPCHYMSLSVSPGSSTVPSGSQLSSSYPSTSPLSSVCSGTLLPPTPGPGAASQRTFPF